MHLESALDGYWIARRRDLSPNTQRDYSLTFSRFSAFVRETPMEEITPQLINEFLNHVRTRHHLGDKTLANTWMALSSLFTWAEKELDLPHPIRNRVACPKWRRPPIEAYTETEIRAMLDACDHASGWNSAAGRRTRSSRPTALRDRAILVTLVDTGLRASELCALTVRDYQQSHGRLTVQHGKGDKRRTVYLGAASQRALWRYLSTRPEATLDAPLFATRTAKPIDRHNLKNLIYSIAKRAGVTGATVHRFRHTYAVNFLRNGGNLLELQQLLGHERIDTLQVYVHLAQSDLAHAQQSASPADKWNL